MCAMVDLEVCGRVPYTGIRNISRTRPCSTHLLCQTGSESACWNSTLASRQKEQPGACSQAWDCSLAHHTPHTARTSVFAGTVANVSHSGRICHSVFLAMIALLVLARDWSALSLRCRNTFTYLKRTQNVICLICVRACGYAGVCYPNDGEPSQHMCAELSRVRTHR